ncbi:hypothetical protein [Halogeometricum luteum]|uniref:SPW repeat-containing protein n=1 Tax=Halogeometricum luteum TaxID=2950537 RepID=A0ABU2G6E2_9EURY|nr:hypothetical protein [Halogeometricum sp. S3BR5-2]MDS0296365.1 hypothetical protein [Halogeometricum sp. S3BR5-2]
MDAHRLERLVWSAAFGYWLGVPLALRLTPDASGPVYLALAALGFLVTSLLVARALAFAESETDRPGDSTVWFAAVGGTVLGLHAVLNFVGVGGTVATFVSIAVGYWVGGRVATRLVASRRDDGPLSS